MTLAQALTPDTRGGGEDVLMRLNAEGGRPDARGQLILRVAAVVVSEPDRMSGSMNIGLRLMMSREAFERTGLMGSAAARHIAICSRWRRARRR